MLRAMTHSPMPDVKAEVRFEGDTFETEDHRNWTDASFKTYVRPLALPWPYVLQEGRDIRTVGDAHSRPANCRSRRRIGRQADCGFARQGRRRHAGDRLRRSDGRSGGRQRAGGGSSRVRVLTSLICQIDGRKTGHCGGTETLSRIGGCDRGGRSHWKSSLPGKGIAGRRTRADRCGGQGIRPQACGDRGFAGDRSQGGPSRQRRRQTGRHSRISMPRRARHFRA